MKTHENEIRFIDFGYSTEKHKNNILFLTFEDEKGNLFEFEISNKIFFQQFFECYNLDYILDRSDDSNTPIQNYYSTKYNITLKEN